MTLSHRSTRCLLSSSSSSLRRSHLSHYHINNIPINISKRNKMPGGQTTNRNYSGPSSSSPKWSFNASKSSDLDHHPDYNNDKQQWHHQYLPRKELLLYILLFSSLGFSFIYWNRKTRQNAIMLHDSMQEHGKELFEAALSNGLAVLAHPEHLDQLKKVMLGEVTEERIALRCCIIPASSHEGTPGKNGKNGVGNHSSTASPSTYHKPKEIKHESQITPAVMDDALMNSCIMTLNVDYHIFPAIATVEQDTTSEASLNSDHIMLKETSRKRLFMNRIIQVDCYIPVNAAPVSRMHTTHDSTKIMALHVRLTHMGEDMSTFVNDFRVTEVDLMDISKLPWRQRWKVPDVKWAWYSSYPKANFEKSVTPYGKLQFIDGISSLHRHFKYDVAFKSGR